MKRCQRVVEITDDRMTWLVGWFLRIKLRMIGDSLELDDWDGWNSNNQNG